MRFLQIAFKNAECHPFFLINISSYLLSDSYMQPLQIRIFEISDISVPPVLLVSSYHISQ